MLCSYVLLMIVEAVFVFALLKVCNLADYGQIYKSINMLVEIAGSMLNFGPLF